VAYSYFLCLGMFFFWDTLGPDFGFATLRATSANVTLPHKWSDKVSKTSWVKKPQVGKKKLCYDKAQVLLWREGF
jgi:hypothetical protein